MGTGAREAECAGGRPVITRPPLPGHSGTTSNDCDSGAGATEENRRTRLIARTPESESEPSREHRCMWRGIHDLGRTSLQGSNHRRSHGGIDAIAVASPQSIVHVLTRLCMSSLDCTCPHSICACRQLTVHAIRDSGIHAVGMSRPTRQRARARSSWHAGRCHCPHARTRCTRSLGHARIQ